MNPEDVTLVMPCYDVADTLPAVLRAVDRLDPSPARFLCIDDGSTDGTTEILRSHDGVELIENETNSGLGVTLNTALAHTETPLFAKIDADVVVPSDWLASILDVYAESGAALVQGRFIEQKTTLADRWRARYPSPSFGHEPRWNYRLNGATILAETEALRDVGGYDERHERAFDDIDLMERLMDAGYDIYYAPSVRSTHIRTDTWREVLRTEWAYQNDLQRGKPTRLSDIVDRLPDHFYESARCLYLDVKYREFECLPISFLRLPYLVAWDVEHVLSMDRS